MSVDTKGEINAECGGFFVFYAKMIANLVFVYTHKATLKALY